MKAMPKKIIVITGKRDSGKSTKVKQLIEDYKNSGKKVAGISTDFVRDKGTGRKISYSIIDLASGSSRTFASEEKGKNSFRFKRFYFRNDAFEFARNSFRRGINADVMVIDEIGWLELEGKGYFEDIEFLLQNFTGILILVIRESILEEILKKMGIYSYATLWMDSI